MVLDHKEGQVSQYLEGLYAHQIQLLVSSSLKNDIVKIDEVSNVFKSLLEAWRESTDVGN